MSKTIVKITGFDKLKGNVLAFITKELKNEAFIKREVAVYAIKQIKSNTLSMRNGYKQKELAPVSVEVRKLIDKTEATSRFYRPSRSNLTFTGQLLDSMRYTILKFIGNRVEVRIFLNDARRAYRTLTKAQTQAEYDRIIDKDRNATNSKRADPASKLKLAALFIAQNQKEKTNNEIQQDLKKQGRNFLFISDQLNTQLRSNIAKALRKGLGSYRKFVKKSL